MRADLSATPRAAMAKVLVILQSNYIPWKGYFDLMNTADEFVLYDEVQFTRRDWRNRNRIVIAGAVRWLTIPVAAKGKYLRPVNEIRVADGRWAERHWASIRHAYGQAPFFADYGETVAGLYERAAGLEYLSEINALFLEGLKPPLGIATPLVSSALVPRRAADPTARLVEICRARGAGIYLSGPAARSYINPAAFADVGIELAYADYSGYPIYPQASRVFEHGVSVIDLLMRVGPEARRHLKSSRGLDAIVAPGADGLEGGGQIAG